MNRHPYGGYDGPAPRRRSASPPFRGGGGGAGGYRGGRGGRAPRGRGGYAGNGDPSYDPYQSQDPYKSQDPYNPPPPAPYATPASINGDFSNSYGAVPPPRDPYFTAAPTGPSQYEDYNPAPRGGARGRGARGRGGRGRDEKQHDSIIEERISRERPCRTLFVRNIKYESSSDDMRAKFEQHGEIKTFFDLIQNRGMVFVTYYDLRDAERARERLQAMEVGGRPIDCHYSLPREHELSQRCDREKNQGTLLITLVQSHSRQAIDENELRRTFGGFGEIKLIKPLYMNGIMRPDQRLLEFFDSRACVDAHDRMHQAPLQDGVMNLEFEWDVPDQPLPTQPVAIPLAGGTRSPAYRGGAGGRSPPRRGGPPEDWDRGRPGPAPYRDGYPDRTGRDFPPDPRDRDRRGGGGAGGGFPPMSPIRDRDRRPSSPYRDERGGRDDRGYGGPPPRRDEWRPRSPPPRSSTDDFGRAVPPGRDAGNDYGRGPGPNGPPYGGQPPVVDSRLEKAMEVQRLLEALKPGSGPAPPGASAPAQQPPAPAPSWYNAPQAHAQAPSLYAQPPPVQYGNPSSYSQPPPPTQYGVPPAASAYPPYGQTSAPTAPSTGDVQSLLALLHQAQNQNHGPR